MQSNAVIDALVMRWDESRARGEETSIDELCRDHPELVDSVSQIIALLRADLSPTPTTISSGGPTDASAPCENTATTSFPGGLDWHDGLRPPEQVGEIGRLGPFRVINLLGAGGMGSVYRAIDTQLGRSVALKVMQALPADAERARARFLREARTAAALQHDHVVSVYQFGEDNGVLYLAMPLLHGLSLRDRLKVSPPLTMAEILRIARETAEGLAGAHELGLIHRDVKPGNIWLEEGSGRVKILDFGLARVADDASQLTQDGLVVGTPAFMAPEQARGQEEFDCRSDLFSLGGILYRMVTGRLPFPADHTNAMLLSLLSDDPVPPRELNPAVSPALEELILRLLTKDPAARLQTARSVVEAIRALERSEATGAQSPLDRKLRGDDQHAAGEGHPKRFTFHARYLILPVAVLISMAIGITAGLALRPRLLEWTRRIVWSRLGPPDRVGPAYHERIVGRPILVPPSIPPPVQHPAIEPTPPEASVAVRKPTIEPWPPAPRVNPKMPGLIPAPVSLTGLGRWQMETRSPRDAVLSLSWSPDGRRIACAAGEKVVRIYEAEGLKLVALLVGHARPVFSADWSPDGRRLATASGDGTIRLWTASGAPGSVLEGHSAGIWCVRWSPDGTRIASASTDHSVRVWNADGTVEHVLEHPEAVVTVAWSPDGKQLVSGAANLLRVWNADGTPGRLLKGHTGRIHAVAWSSDGTSIASGSDDLTVRLWSADGTPGPVLSDHEKIVRAVAWSPDGNRLASAGGDSKVRIWSADGSPEAIFSGLTRTVDSVAWSADGQRLAAGSSAAELRVWDADGHAGPALDPIRTRSALAFSPDGTKIVSASSSHPSLLVWGPEHVPGMVLKSRSRQVKALAWNPDRTLIGAAGSDRTVQLWHVDGTRGPTLVGHHGEVNAVAWSPDGNHLASASDDSMARLWSADGKPGPVLSGHKGRVLAVIWSPDGRRLATAGEDGLVRFWGADGTLQRPPVKSGSPVGVLAWSPDGSRLAVGNLGGALHLWGPDEPATPPLTIKAGNTEAIAWHPDGTRFATAGPTSIMRLWDIDGHEGPALPGQLSAGDWREGGVSVAWAPGSDRLMAASRHGFVWAWNTRTLAPLWVAIQTAPAGVAVFNPEGRLLGSDPAALDSLVYMLEKPDRSMELLTHQEFEQMTAGKR